MNLPPWPSLPLLKLLLHSLPHYYYEFKHHNHFHNNTSHNFTKKKWRRKEKVFLVDWNWSLSFTLLVRIKSRFPPPSQSPRPLPTLILLLLHDSRLLLRRWRSRIFLLPRNEKSHAHNSKDFSPILKKGKKRSGFVALFDHIFEI